MSDAVMPDSFEWPDQETLKDDASFRMWLIQTLQRIHDRVSETARLQREANGRVAKLETAVAPIPAMEVRLTLVERMLFGASALLLVAMLGAMARMVLRA